MVREWANGYAIGTGRREVTTCDRQTIERPTG